jgi:glutamate carboxypeptidase
MTKHHPDRLEDRIGERALALLEELCAISSPSGDGAGLRRMALHLAAELEAQGLVCEVLQEPNGTGDTEPVLLARAGHAEHGHVLLVGHLDTVLPATATHRDGDRLFGTGALDMKGGLVTLVAALALMRGRGIAPPEDLLFVGTPDEEASGIISERLTRQFGGRARVMLVLEPGEPREEGGTIVVGRRGLTEWRLEIRGTPAHSGLAYWTGRSALAAAADWCRHAQKMSRHGRGTTVNVARLVAGDGDFVLQLDRHHGLLGTSRRRNVIPDHAVADGEIRFLSTRGGEQTLQRLQALADRVAELHGVEVALTSGTTFPPVMPRGTGAQLVERALALAAQRGWTLHVERDRGGISFPNYLDGDADLPVLDGLGPVGRGMHTREEHLDLRSLQRRIVLLADLLATL